MWGTFHKGPRNIYFYDGVDENVLELDALQKCNVPLSDLNQLFVYFSASSGTVLQMQLPKSHKDQQRSRSRTKL